MIKVIVAVAENGVIGKDDAIPWKIPPDLAEFKRLTTGHAVAMARKTFFSLPAKFRPLPGRENIVLTRDPERLRGYTVTTANNFEEILERSQKEDIFVAGGSELYRLAMPHARWFFLTRVKTKADGNIFFPDWERFWSLTGNPAGWECVSSEDHKKNAMCDLGFTWEVYLRKTE